MGKKWWCLSVTSTKPSTAHPELIPLLERFGLTWQQFSRKGRLPKDLRWIAEKRREVITALHLTGMSCLSPGLSRLRAASSFAAAQGWAFLVWTEKDFGDARSSAA
jgi:hypothetical protein